ncbi:MAG: protein-glutamate methylesterase/protein-glutamine glutaminase, partial [Bosea sp. (in: a-proteobacteria)]
RASVLIVDDSVVARGLFNRWISEHPRLEVVGLASDGLNAVRMASRLQPNLIILDIDMPVMDGLTALPEILKASPDSCIVIASSLTARSARLSLQCLSLGATDIQPKPDSNRDLTMSLSFRHELIAKLEGLIGANITAAKRRKPASLAAATVSQPPATSAATQRASNDAPASSLRFEATPRLIVIGASTGGPRAIANILHDMKDACSRVPVIIVQHMPAVFTASLANQLQTRLERPVREPFHGEVPTAGTIFIAPGGQHLRLVRNDGQIRMMLDDSPPVKFCKPSVDVTFSDAAHVYGASTLGMILTGMGNDGLDGVRLLRESGATIIAQDEATSVVWGMPGAVVREGLAHHVMPLDQIGGAIHAALFVGARR